MNERRHVKMWLVACVVTLFFVAGCSRVDLYQNLTEEEANEILVLLSENNIKPTKKRVVAQNEVSYSVQVREADMVRARSLLLKNNLPRRRELGLTGVYKDKGLIPTPDEQKARFLLAVKGEIINSLERIPQIIDADVVLNVPTKDEFADAEKQKLQRPTASVVVRIMPNAGSAEEVSEAKIQQFVANSVEGLNPRDVTVIISYIGSDDKTIKPGDVKTLPSPLLPSLPAVGAPLLPATPHEIMGLKVDTESKAKLKMYVLVFFLLLVVLSTALIIVIVQASRTRRMLAAMKGPAGDHPAIEGHVIDEGPPRLGDGQ